MNTYPASLPLLLPTTVNGKSDNVIELAENFGYIQAKADIMLETHYALLERDDGLVDGEGEGGDLSLAPEVELGRNISGDMKQFDRITHELNKAIRHIERNRQETVSKTKSAGQEMEFLLYSNISKEGPKTKNTLRAYKNHIDELREYAEPFLLEAMKLAEVEKDKQTTEVPRIVTGTVKEVLNLIINRDISG